jgi:hypothetical protein
MKNEKKTMERYDSNPRIHLRLKDRTAAKAKHEPLICIVSCVKTVETSSEGIAAASAAACASHHKCNS